MISIFIPGIPQPGGSKRAFPFRRKNGKLGVAVSDANPRVHGWREVVAYTVAQAMPAPLEGPVEMCVRFYMPRPKGHYRTAKAPGTLRLRPGAPVWHTSRPDTTKLVRALEDALKGIAWTDDSQVCYQRVEKRYADDGTVGAEVEIRPIGIVEAQEKSHQPPG